MLQDITAQGERRQEIRDQRPSSNFGTTLYCTVLDMGAMKPVTLFCLLLPVCAVFLTGSIACVAETLQKSIRYLSQETLRNPTKSAEIPRGIRKASVQLSAE